MLKFNLFRIPVGVDWYFWLTLFLLGGGIGANNSRQMQMILVWMAVAFVSILVHELGHAGAGRKYGASPVIQLHGLGGLTIFPGAQFTRGQNIAVTAAGPAAGLALGIGVWFLARNVELRGLVGYALFSALYINFAWTILNLLPILPLDGGQILGSVLGPRRFQLVCWIGCITASAVALWAFLNHRVFLGLFMVMFAIQNFQQRTAGKG